MRTESLRFPALVVLAILMAVVLAALGPRTLVAGSTAETYPTTCQWNGCPQPGDVVCLVAWDGHYICTKPRTWLAGG